MYNTYADARGDANPDPEWQAAGETNTTPSIMPL